MATLGDIAETVAKDMLTRTDAQHDWMLKCAKRAYLMVCNKIPFQELREISDELSLTSGTNEYDLSSLITDQINGVFSIRLTTTNAKRRLKRTDPEVYDSYTTVPNGTPYSYARIDNLKIQLNPTPNSSSDTIRVRYWKKPTIGTDVASTVLEIPEEWEELVEYETLYRAYHFLQEFGKAMALVSPNPVPMPGSSKKRYSTEVGILPRLWNDLLETVNRREHPEMDFSIAPLVRSYTEIRGRR